MEGKMTRLENNESPDYPIFRMKLPQLSDFGQKLTETFNFDFFQISSKNRKFRSK